MTIFVDTNVLLYAVTADPASARKRAVATRLLLEQSCAVSIQVLNEFVWQSTKHRRADRVALEDALDLTKAWRRFPIQPLDLECFDAARDMARRTNYSWWDCLILAAARLLGCDTVASEDMGHGHVIGGVRIDNPFLDTP